MTASSRYLRGGEVVHVQWDLGLGGFALLVGLSFDEVLLIGVLAGAAAIVLTRLVGRRRHPSPHP
jgi:hypothetical protein